MVDYENHVYVMNEVDPSCKDIDYITVCIEDGERFMCAKSVMIEAKKYNYTLICLKVLKSFWVHDLYANHGYSVFCHDSEDADYVWMKHTL